MGQHGFPLNNPLRLLSLRTLAFEEVFIGEDDHFGEPYAMLGAPKTKAKKTAAKLM